MKYIKTYESYITGSFNDDLSKTIDDAFSNIVDSGFEKLDSKPHPEALFSSDLTVIYKRINKSNIGLKVTGDLKNGELRLHNDKPEEIKEYGEEIYQIYEELINALHIISGVSGVDLKFSLSNFYGEDKIIIYSFKKTNENQSDKQIREYSQGKLEQLRDCFLELQDYGLEINMVLDEYNRIIVNIKKPDRYSVDELTDMMEGGDMDWSDYYEEMAFDMTDDIIDVLKFANSYCEELGIGQGNISYNTFDEHPPYSESTGNYYDNFAEFMDDYDSHGQVESIEIIYVIKSNIEKYNEDFDHLSSRGIDPNVTYFVHDEESNNTYFFLYNLSGDCVGYQKYNPDNPKEGGLGWMGRYFTKVHKEASGHSKIAVYGLETYKMGKDYFFVAEGIFDIIKVHNAGEPGIANLGCSVSRQAKNWYHSLPQKKIVIQDRDDAGTELGTVGDYIYTVPEPYKDLGDMPQEEVNEFIKNIKKEIGI